jgi:hypothetical protein
MGAPVLRPGALICGRRLLHRLEGDAWQCHVLAHGAHAEPVVISARRLTALSKRCQPVGRVNSATGRTT